VVLRATSCFSGESVSAVAVMAESKEQIGIGRDCNRSGLHFS
jgi:hypothetical protein